MLHVVMGVLGGCVSIIGVCHMRADIGYFTGDIGKFLVLKNLFSFNRAI